MARAQFTASMIAKMERGMRRPSSRAERVRRELAGTPYVVFNPSTGLLVAGGRRK